GRHHVLSHVRRQWNRGYRIGTRTRESRPRNPLHHLLESHTARSGHSADSLSRGGSIELPAISVPALLPGFGIPHGGSGPELFARSAARALRDPALDFRFTCT